MKPGLSRRSLLCGLMAAPAVVYVGHLMPLRGVKFDPLMRIQSWPFKTTPTGAWAVSEVPLSQFAKAQSQVLKACGSAYSDSLDNWRAERIWFDDQSLPNRLLTDVESIARPVQGIDYQTTKNPIVVSADTPVEYAQRWGYAPLPEERLVKTLIRSPTKRIPTEELRAQLASVCQWGA